MSDRSGIVQLCRTERAVQHWTSRTCCLTVLQGTGKRTTCTALLGKIFFKKSIKKLHNLIYSRLPVVCVFFLHRWLTSSLKFSPTQSRVFFFRTATCFGPNRPSSDHQYNVLRTMLKYNAYRFTLCSYYSVGRYNFTIFGHPVLDHYKTSLYFWMSCILVILNYLENMMKCIQGVPGGMCQTSGEFSLH